jgi:hypothetical protein
MGDEVEQLHPDSKCKKKLFLSISNSLKNAHRMRNKHNCRTNKIKAFYDAMSDLPEMFERLKNGKLSWMTSLGVRLPHCKYICNKWKSCKY